VTLLTAVFYKLKMMISDKIFFISMIVLPVFIILATGYALRHEKLGTIPVIIVDEDVSADSMLLIDRLKDKEGIELEISDRSTASQKLRQNKVEAVFVIREGFSKELQKNNYTGLIDFIKSPASYSSDYVSEIIAGEVLRIYSSYVAAGKVVLKYNQIGKTTGEDLFNEVRNFTDTFWEPEPLMKMEYYELSGKEYDREAFYMPAATATSAGIIMVFIMLYILFCSGWLVEERTNGTLKRLVAGANALLLTYGANIISMFISGMLQIFIFACTIKLVFGVVLFTGILSYMVMAAYLLSVISISMLMSSVFRTSAQLQSAAPAFALITGFLGGCFWNFVNIPENMKALAALTPQGWALSAINRLIANPDAALGIQLELMVLLIIPLILLPLSYIIIRTGMRFEKINA